MTTTMKFRNACETLPIIVSGWKSSIPGLGEYTSITVLPGTEVEVTSSVGEWLLESLFYDREHADLWEKEGLPFESRLAKFRDKPCAMGNYTWNFIENKFSLVYEAGVVIWSYKST
jgi:hypothetical protein